jgi:type IV secretion system protein VirB2
MQKQQHFNRNAVAQPGTIDWRLLGRLAVVAIIVAPALVMAQDTAISKTCQLLDTVQTLLKGVSVVVVTIAIIFAGYQIAFAHKRIAEVAPVLLGGLLIGAASQIASMILGSQGECGNNASIEPDSLTQLASIAHSLAGYFA